MIRFDEGCFVTQCVCVCVCVCVHTRAHTVIRFDEGYFGDSLCVCVCVCVCVCMISCGEMLSQ